MLQRIALLAIAYPRRILAVAAAVLVGAVIFGLPAANSLSAGGFQDPTSASARAAETLTDSFGQGEMDLVIVVTAPDSATGPAARRAGLDIVDRLTGEPNVASVTSAWTSPPMVAAELISRDKRSGVIVAGITGGENNGPYHAHLVANMIKTSVLPEHGDVEVLIGGSAMVYSEINHQTRRDLLLMESIAIPLSFAVLIWVFGGLVAAALPLAVGTLAIVGSMAVLRLITFSTDVSIFALNLSTAMGLALAIDYTLLILSRYRDEVADGMDRDQALIRTMMTAGRTVLFSAVTVALSMSAMVLFPMYFLKSFAYAGVATVGFCALAALFVAPAAIALLGSRIDALNIRTLTRRGRQPTPAAPAPVDQLFFYRSAKFVMRRALPIGLAGVAVLLLLGAPFLGIRWGFPDDRVLPTTAAAHQVGDRLRTGFIDNAQSTVTVVIDDAEGLTPRDFEQYAEALSMVPDVSHVSAPTATFVAGRKVGPGTAAGVADGHAYLTVGSDTQLFSTASDSQLDRLHAVPGPGGREVALTGIAQINRDSVAAITSRIPVVFAVIALITFVLLFLLTGSVVLPLKALVLNVLSLSAAFGALVWVFQEGHLGAFGTTPTGTLVATMPVLMFCIAFGLSMDYEVFLISRIREFWLNRSGTQADNSEAVARGLARTGRVITAAALVMSISFAALIAAQVSFMRMFGLGLTLAILVDATLVRVVLVPAFMQVLGRWNWWAPKPLVALHRRIGISESVPDVAVDPRDRPVESVSSVR